MDRRCLLSSLAAAPVALAGCLGRDDPAGRTTTDATSTRTTDATTDDATPSTVEGDVTVSDVTVAPELVAMNSPDSIAAYGDRGEQFVAATVAATRSLGVDDFELDAGGETHPATTDVGYGSLLWKRGQPYGEEPQGWLAFRLPNPLDADAAAIAWPDGEHALDADAVARLARPPTTFEVREFAAPETAAPGDTVTATLTVANVGDADGTFVAALNRVGPRVAYTPEATVSLDVAAGATATREFTHTLSLGDDGSMRLKLNWRDGSLEQTTEIESE